MSKWASSARAERTGGSRSFMVCKRRQFQGGLTVHNDYRGRETDKRPANSGAPAPQAASRKWLSVLFAYAARCRGKMAASFLLSVMSVGAGLIPFLCVYKMLQLFMDPGFAPTADAIALWLGLAAAAYVASKILFGASTLLSHVSAYTILAGLRHDFADRLMRASLGTSSTKSIGAIKNVFIDRIEGVEVPLAHMIPELSGALILVAAIAVWLFAIDWRIALSCLVTVPLGLVVFASGLASYNKMYAAFMEQSNYVNSVIVEYIEGIEVVKMFNQASGSYAKYADAVRDFREFALGWFKATWVTMNLAFAILPTTLLGVLPCGLWLYQAGQISPAMLTLAVILALAVVPPIMKLSAFLNETKSMEFAVADADEFLTLPALPEVSEAAQVTSADIAFCNVRFGYGDEEVIHGASFCVPEGSFCALVGPSGSGKSTLARLLARHWDTDAGEVRIGGVSVRDMPLEQLSSLVSYVAQDNYLFDDTLRENIRMGQPQASDAEVEAAAAAASCDEFLGRLPLGLDTPAGAAGHGLSGGERQRISLARAILKDAPIIVLDEATAFTDPDNEDKIQKSISRLARHKTLLVIAHRLSTVTGADNIVVLDDGRVAAQGTHGELLASSSLYRSMWEAHVGASDWTSRRRAEDGCAGRKEACRA